MSQLKHIDADVQATAWHKMYCSGTARAPLVEQPPMDSTGRWLAPCDSTSAIGEITIDVPGKVNLGDCLNVVGGYKILSTRAVDVISGLRKHDNVRFCDIIVIRRALSMRQTWHWMDSGGDLDVVDWGRSIIIKSALSVGPGMVYRGVLDRKRIPSCDMFFGNTGFLYVSDVLRERFDYEHLKGFSFEEVEVV
jgi:hypothetical protein